LDYKDRKIQRTQKQLHTKVNTHSITNDVKNMQEGYLVTVLGHGFSAIHVHSIGCLLSFLLGWLQLSKGYWSLAANIS
jgi:hypothetical protein